MTNVRLPNGTAFYDVRHLDEFTKAWHRAMKKKQPMKLHRKAPNPIYINPFQIIYIA